MCCNPPSSQQLFAKWTRNSGCFRIWHVLGDGFGSIGILKKVSWLLKEWSGFVSCASLVFFSEACKHLHSIDSLDQKLRTHKFGACVQSNLYKQVNLTCHNGITLLILIMPNFSIYTLTPFMSPCLISYFPFYHQTLRNRGRGESTHTLILTIKMQNEYFLFLDFWPHI
jgi:hypothetical protein